MGKARKTDDEPGMRHEGHSPTIFNYHPLSVSCVRSLRFVPGCVLQMPEQKVPQRSPFAGRRQSRCPPRRCCRHDCRNVVQKFLVSAVFALCVTQESPPIIIKVIMHNYREIFKDFMLSEVVLERFCGLEKQVHSIAPLGKNPMLWV